MSAPNEREWRCGTCGTLLGVERQGRMFLKYKTAQYIVTGPIMAVCRRCTEISETLAAPAGAAAARESQA